MISMRGVSRIEEVVMRRWLVVFALLGLIHEARADDDLDLPTLRGSEPFVPAPPSYRNWGGFYFGGNLSKNSGSFDFSTATQSLVAFSLRQLTLESEAQVSTWEVLGKPTTNSVGLGAFAGYNTQWDDLILGFEAGYNRVGISAFSQGSPLNIVTSAGGNSYDVHLTGTASMHIYDYVEARGRAGWVVGSFLPYVSVGAVVGRADFTRSSDVAGVQNEFFPFDASQCPGGAHPTCAVFDFPNSETKKGAIIFGWSVGGGIDVMVMPNAFLRAEFDYVRFAPISDIKAAIATGRIGAGVKF
jgi:opacity protein-like surface antigen